MELKDVILSTLAEMEDTKPQIDEQSTQKETSKEKIQIQEEKNIEINAKQEPQKEQNLGSETLFLKSIRERLLVLFEGFQAPNNTNIEAKVDMTLNFLEYVLVTVDSRIEELERGKDR